MCGLRVLCFGIWGSAKKFANPSFMMTSLRFCKWTSSPSHLPDDGRLRTKGTMKLLNFRISGIHPAVNFVGRTILSRGTGGLCSLDPNLTSSISSGHALGHTYNSNIMKVSDSFWIWSSVFVPAPAPRLLDVSSLPFPLGSTIGGGQTFNTNTKVTWPTFVKQESSHGWVCDLGAVGDSLIFGLVGSRGFKVAP